MDTAFSTRQSQTLAAIVDTFVPSVVRDDDPTGFFATKGSDVGAHLAAEQYLLARLGPEQLAGMQQLLDTAAVIGMKDQSQSVREAIVGNLSRISPETHAAVAALKQISMLFAYGLPDAAGRNPFWAGMGYPGPVQAPPPTPKTLTTVTPVDGQVFEADVVIVGSGCGGGLIAGKLAQAGQKVIVVELGSYRNESDFVQLELAAYQTLFLRGGFFPSGDGNLAIATASTVGGGSTVNWSNSLVTPKRVRDSWAAAGLTDVAGPAFDDHLAAVMERIGCNETVSTQNEVHSRITDAATKLGYSYRVTPLNVDPDRYDPALAGYSGMGDQTGAKQSTMLTYLQDACDAGASIMTNTRADRILIENSSAAGVEGTYTDPVTGQTARVVIKAPTVVAAAGSLETPALLLRSGIGGPAVGKGLHTHPATLVAGIYDTPQEQWYGPGMAGAMDEFAESNEGYGYLIEGVQHLPALFATIVPWLSGEQNKELCQKYRYRSDFLVLLKDRGTGSVTIDDNGEAVHWYPFDDELDRRNFREALVTCIRMHEAAGAQEIFTAGQAIAPWQRGEDLEAYIEKVNQFPIGPGGTPVFCAHQMSSARLGVDPQTSVANTAGELHDAPGVWIGDASGMPTCSGANPMLTVMALAHRTASNMLTKTRDRAESSV
jgi:choline dehydrogenase-like flavoprotein